MHASSELQVDATLLLPAAALVLDHNPASHQTTVHNSNDEDDEDGDVRFWNPATASEAEVSASGNCANNIMDSVSRQVQDCSPQNCSPRHP